MVPRARDAPAHWAWAEVQPFTDRAAREVPMEDAERRAMILANPDFGGQTITTGSLIAAFSVLEPGDRARPHRHTMSALRFATDSEGAVTFVNGRRCAMHPGDLIITPPMSWHGHINESDRRLTWFDAADSPLLRDFDANFFEGGSNDAAGFWSADAGDERVWTGAGLAPLDPPAAGTANPRFHYPGAETRRLLAEVGPSADGSHGLRYVNPLTGGAVMPTIDCAALRLKPGAATRTRRATWNAVCLVVAGEGRSTIGDRRFDWAQNDVFTIPHWTWAEHRALSGEADLFVVSDRAAYEALGFARTELG
jgi:gentisate 1,2-dioxygenase